MKKLILASTSPYRKALLSQLHLPFECHNSQVDEESFKEEIKDPLELTKRLALEKAKAVFNSLAPEEQKDVIVIGGDQVSLHQGEILGKPHTSENAINQIMQLQGSEHQLVSATCLLSCSKTIEWTEVTKLKMRPLTREQATKYIQIDSPLDCAGSYKIESLGINLFESIDCPDSTAIIGLPLIRLSSYLRESGLDPLN